VRTINDETRKESSGERDMKAENLKSEIKENGENKTK
jgi:hypothetical protein